MINNVVLVGRLTKDPEIQYTQGGNGVAFINFQLAVNRTFTNSKGEREADFIGCQLWRKSAENLAKYASKGSLIGLEGRIQTSSYENQQGQRIYRTDVVADRFSLLESKQEAQIRQQNSKPISPKPQNNEIDKSNGDSISPKQQNDGMGDPFYSSSKPIDISDDDLPF